MLSIHISSAVTDLVASLYWYAIILLLGGLLAFAVPVRPRWLILLAVPLALPSLFLLRESVAEGVLFALSVLLYLLSWTAGVFIGRALRRRSGSRKQA